MSFLPAISLLALLMMLPILLSLRQSAAGMQSFCLGCALAAIAIALMILAGMVSAILPVVVGYGALISACLFILLGFRGLLALPAPAFLLPALVLAAGIVGLVVSLNGDDRVGALLLVVGLASALLLVAGLAVVDRWPKARLACHVVIVISVAVGCAALFHALTPLHQSAAAPASVASEFALAAMRVAFLPLLFLAVILSVQSRIIAGLRTTIARDGLTGALSRGALIEAGERIFADCAARRRPLAFLLLDLDYFKQINDHYGHACGDIALKHFAETVSAFLDGRGAFGRIGGEEFGLILPDHTEEQATALAEAICRTVRETPVTRVHQRIRLTVSIGIAAAAPGDTITDVMIRADLALYDSKADGRDRCTIARQRQIDASARALAAAAAQLRQSDSRPQPEKATPRQATRQYRS
ncbi:GGDEF domain-containing protein [Sinorhizobium terangae]|uniref:diguanylate cyclase n=1 Tax=Sinorhizobium terangae TaxID=110322 RepID=A0A6N7L9F8_SINTE|nr:GGDEF domain-containing protein [Sinorhizobium terangae]MBB4185541.1 diguanylate cyclase (GGDEF)-like protein [Sinorhizobium terangae]MQX14246.1 diguanylate cyclase [Sinorhizobium terangae]WFU46388.1 GGDEF domain-containing protein [Sinorhizobium terangae]